VNAVLFAEGEEPFLWEVGEQFYLVGYRMNFGCLEEAAELRSGEVGYT